MNTNDFQKVVKAVNIREVFMVSTNCKCHVHYAFVEPKFTRLEVNKSKINTKYIVSEKSKTGTMLSTVNFTIEGISQKDIKVENKEIIRKKGDALFTISVSYIVTYDVNDTNLDKEAVEFFGKENAYFNVYPYLREFITHISQRFNLHPVIIPLLKPNDQSAKFILNEEKNETSHKKRAKNKNQKKH